MNDKLIFGLTEMVFRERLLAWFNSLDERRGPRAELRRAHDAGEAECCGEAWNFVHQLDLPSDPKIPKTRLAQVAGILVWFKDHEPGASLAKQMAKHEHERCLVSDLRFRRILKTPNREELFTSLRRVVPLLGHSGNLVDLVQAYCFWGETQRRHWARDYYEAAPKPQPKGKS